MSKRLPSALLCLALLAGSLSGCALPVQGAQSAPAQAAVSTPAPTATPAPAAETPDEAPPAPTAAPTPAGEYVEGYDPLTGEATEADDTSRPVAVMVQNGKAGYPQWGIKGAEVMVEAISEGKYTSMMCLYSGNEGLPDKVGAVGPGRDLFWQLAMPMNSILMQIGGNVYASNLLNYYSYQNLDGYYAGVSCFDLDYEKDKTANNEYCWFTTQALMEDGLAKYELPSSGDRHSLFNFGAGEPPAPTAAPAASSAAASSGAPAASGEATPTPAAALAPKGATRIEITFAEDNTIPLLYNEDAARWEKYDLDWEPQVDGSYPEDMDPMEKIVSFDNVFVLYCSAGVKDDGYTRDYDLTEGTGLYLNGPTCRFIRWQKGDVFQGFTVYDSAGNELPVQPGKSYIAIYGGFEGQGLKVQNAAGDELKVWKDPKPLPARATPTPTPTPEETEAPEEGPAEDEGEPEGEPESQPEG